MQATNYVPGVVEYLVKDSLGVGHYQGPSLSKAEAQAARVKLMTPERSVVLLTIKQLHDGSWKTLHTRTIEDVQLVDSQPVELDDVLIDMGDRTEPVALQTPPENLVVDPRLKLVFVEAADVREGDLLIQNGTLYVVLDVRAGGQWLANILSTDCRWIASNPHLYRVEQAN